MINANLISAWGCQSNPHYQRGLENNGGGYWQPSGGALFDAAGEKITVCLEDASCGDFGTRIFVSAAANNYLWSFTFGSMVDAEDNVFATQCIDSIEGILGVDFCAMLDTVTAAVDIMANVCEEENENA